MGQTEPVQGTVSIGTKHTWAALALCSPSGEEIVGTNLFRGLHLAVEELEKEHPGGMDIDTIGYVVGRIADAAQCLYEARNALRRSNGLPEITLPNEEDGARST